MRILVLSDIHGNLEKLEKIVKLIHNDVALVLITGDLTNFGSRQDTENVLGTLEGLDVLAIPGNLDTKEVLDVLEERKISLHARKKKIGEFVFAGFGGGKLGGKGPFNSSEEKIKEGLARVLEGGKNAVALTHMPPYGTKLDLASDKSHIGSTAVKEAILEKQPLLHLCGHAHESFGEEKIGETISINVGAVNQGMALALELGEKIKWERIQV